MRPNPPIIRAQLAGSGTDPALKVAVPEKVAATFEAEVMPVTSMVFRTPLKIGMPVAVTLCPPTDGIIVRETPSTITWLIVSSSTTDEKLVESEPLPLPFCGMVN
jgi:hypothetical protein